MPDGKQWPVSRGWRHLLPKLNHLFQTCQTGALTEYGEIEETVSPSVLAMVADWILKTANP